MYVFICIFMYIYIYMYICMYIYHADIDTEQNRCQNTSVNHASDSGEGFLVVAV